jgi:hypothetical protein
VSTPPTPLCSTPSSPLVCIMDTAPVPMPRDAQVCTHICYIYLLSYLLISFFNSGSRIDSFALLSAYCYHSEWLHKCACVCFLWLQQPAHGHCSEQCDLYRTRGLLLHIQSSVHQHHQHYCVQPCHRLLPRNLPQCQDMLRCVTHLITRLNLLYHIY